MHHLLVSDSVGATIGGVDYYEFLLDVNQTAADPILSLDNVQIFTRAVALRPLRIVWPAWERFGTTTTPGPRGIRQDRSTTSSTQGAALATCSCTFRSSFFAGAFSTENRLFLLGVWRLQQFIRSKRRF